MTSMIHLEEEKRYQDEIESRCGRKKTLFYQAEVESASTLEINDTEVESLEISAETNLKIKIIIFYSDG